MFRKMGPSSHAVRSLPNYEMVVPAPAKANEDPNRHIEGGRLAELSPLCLPVTADDAIVNTRQQVWHILIFIRFF